MKKHIKNWWMKDAEWYQFWMPQSSVTGGLIILALSIILCILLDLLFVDQARAEIKSYTVTWSMMEAHSVPCPHTWIDDYGRVQGNLGCLVDHRKWSDPYIGERDFDSMDKAIAFIEEKQNKWRFPQKCYGFKILFGKSEILYPDPKQQTYEFQGGDLETGITCWVSVSGTSIREKRKKMKPFN